jgi:hypothetical protein
MIRPDAITISVGQAQTFSVENASVLAFSVTSDAGSWTQFARADSEAEGANAIRLIALKRTAGGYLHVSANIGPGRSPLVAVVSIE